MMKVFLYIPIFLIFQRSQAYFEQKIIRRGFTYDPNLTKINIDEFDLPECPEPLLALKHNATFVTQVCFQKDLFYNVELILGEDKAVEFALDLTSPWTWYKSKSCKKCRRFDPEFLDKCKNDKKEDCSNDQFDTNYDSPKLQDNLKTAKMYSDDQLVSGQFQTDKISFLAYNSSRRVRLGEYLAEKFGKNEVLDQVTINDVKMMSVSQIFGAQRYLSDGVLGLGFGFAETDDDDAEPDVDFIEKLIQQDTNLQLTRQRFSIYCLETGHYFPDFVMQFGGYDVKYAHEHSSDIVWLQRVPNSGYYWMVELNAITLQQLNHDQDYTQNVTMNRAIFSLSSQFIELPKKELKYFLDTMNSFGMSTNCSLVDDEFLMVYCTNLIFPIHFVDLKVFFTFEDNKRVQLSSHLLYRNCTESPQNVQIQNCLLNVRFSKSGYVILGEPFMKWHYTIFDNEPGKNMQISSQFLSAQIGLLPAASNMYYLEHNGPIFDPANWYLYKAVIYIFVFGIIFMCCAVNCRRASKDCYRAWTQRKALSTEDQKKLRVKQIDDELNSSELEDDYKVQAAAQQKKQKDDWENTDKQFDFQMKFDPTTQIEDNSL